MTKKVRIPLETPKSRFYLKKIKLGIRGQYKGGRTASESTTFESPPLFSFLFLLLSTRIGFQINISNKKTSGGRIMNNYERDIAFKLGYNPARDITAAAAGKRKVSFQFSFNRLTINLCY